VDDSHSDTGYASPAARGLILDPTAGAEALLYALLVTTLAAWAAHHGVLPGRSHGLAGTALQGVAWLGVYVALGVAYVRAARESPIRFPLRVVRRLGIALCLTLLSSYLAMHLLTPRLAPAEWWDFFYLRWLGPMVLAGIWCAALLPRETSRLVRWAARYPATIPLPQLALLLAVAALLVAGGDLSFYWGGSSPILDRMKEEVIQPRPWATTTALLLSAFALVFVITRRVLTALLLVSPLYVVFGLACLIKIEYLHSAVQPLDLLKLPEFLPLFPSFFGIGGVLATVLGTGLWIYALAATRRLEPTRMPAGRRWSVGALACAVLVGLPGVFLLSGTRAWAKALVIRLGGPDDQHRELARVDGFLVSFLSQLPAAAVSPPRDYSAATVTRVVSRYPTPRADTLSAKPPVNLIVYLVESLMDPADLGVRYTADPIPNLRALGLSGVRGHAYVPERFSGSANTEFELLTGMTRSFLPEGSVPYLQYLRQPVPSLARLLRRSGYTTIAVQADPKYWYDRERAYDLLGFERAVWLRSGGGLARAPRGAWVSDQELVRVIIRTSQEGRPFFAFAFPSSTHSPYNSGAFASSDLDVSDLPQPEAGEVKEYFNALRVADSAIGAMVEYFRRRPEPTIIVVLGDHLPPLSERALRPFFARLTSLPEEQQARRARRVPLLVWSNRKLPREELEVSTSLLPSYLLQRMGVPVSGLFAVADRVRERLPVLPARASDGSSELAEEALVEDYRIIQYDLLLGRQFSLGPDGAHWAGLPGAH
jgi:Sulfatase